ncbi:MAG: Potassium channel protein, partial [uncultured Rubrobacteraceae bacterium]
ALLRRRPRPRGRRHRERDGRDALPARALGAPRRPPHRGLLATAGRAAPGDGVRDHRRLRDGDGLDRGEGRGGPPRPLCRPRRVRRDRAEAHRLARLPRRRQDPRSPPARDRDRHVRPRRQPNRALDLPPPRHLHAQGRRLPARHRRPRGPRAPRRPLRPKAGRPGV